MRLKKRRKQDDEKPGRKKRILRDIEDREWEKEIRYVAASIGQESDIPALLEEEELTDDTEWVP